MTFSCIGVDKKKFPRIDKTWQDVKESGERYAACNIIQHETFGSRSLMVWGNTSMQ